MNLTLSRYQEILGFLLSNNIRQFPEPLLRTALGEPRRGKTDSSPSHRKFQKIIAKAGYRPLKTLGEPGEQEPPIPPSEPGPTEKPLPPATIRRYWDARGVLHLVSGEFYEPNFGTAGHPAKSLKQALMTGGEAPEKPVPVSGAALPGPAPNPLPPAGLNFLERILPPLAEGRIRGHLDARLGLSIVNTEPKDPVSASANRLPGNQGQGEKVLSPPSRYQKILSFLLSNNFRHFPEHLLRRVALGETRHGKTDSSPSQPKSHEIFETADYQALKTLEEPGDQKAPMPPPDQGLAEKALPPGTIRRYLDDRGILHIVSGELYEPDPGTASLPAEGFRQALPTGSVAPGKPLPVSDAAWPGPVADPLPPAGLNPLERTLPLFAEGRIRGYLDAKLGLHIVNTEPKDPIPATANLLPENQEQGNKVLSPLSRYQKILSFLLSHSIRPFPEQLLPRLAFGKPGQGKTDSSPSQPKSRKIIDIADYQDARTLEEPGERKAPMPPPEQGLAEKALSPGTIRRYLDDRGILHIVSGELQEPDLGNAGLPAESLEQALPTEREAPEKPLPVSDVAWPGPAPTPLPPAGLNPPEGTLPPLAGGSIRGYLDAKLGLHLVSTEPKDPIPATTNPLPENQEQGKEGQTPLSRCQKVLSFLLSHNIRHFLEYLSQPVALGEPPQEKTDSSPSQPKSQEIIEKAGNQAPKTLEKPGEPGPPMPPPEPGLTEKGLPEGIIRRYLDAQGVLHIVSGELQEPDLGNSGLPADNLKQTLPTEREAPEKPLPVSDVAWPGQVPNPLPPASPNPLERTLPSLAEGSIRGYLDAKLGLHIVNTEPKDPIPGNANILPEYQEQGKDGPNGLVGKAYFPLHTQVSAAPLPGSSAQAPPLQGEGTIRRYRDPHGVLHIETVEHPKPAPPTAQPLSDLPKNLPDANAYPPAIPAPVQDGRGLLNPMASEVTVSRDRNGGLVIQNQRFGTNIAGLIQRDQLVAQISPIIQEASRLNVLPVPLIQAVIKVESNFVCWAVSPKGAMGLMQLMPETAAFLGVQDPFDPRQNILGGCRYLRLLLDYFQGSVPLALAGYNAGYNRVVSAGCQVPPIKETQEFVTQVMGLYYLLETYASGL